MTKHYLNIRVLTALAVGVLVSTQALAVGERFKELDDAAVAEAKVWQAGGKARPLMSSDGKVIFAYGQSMPKLTCSPTRACDIEMEAGEKVKKVILGDGINWHWDGAESIEHGQPVQHVVVQPVDKNLESNAIIATDRRTYHIKLYSPSVEGAYLNRIGFYYPEALVSSWADKVKEQADATAKDDGLKVMKVAVRPEKLAFDYRIEGDADFKPLRVFNDGERVYMAMPDSLRTGESPVFSLIDEKGNQMVVNYRSETDPTTGTIHYVVDKLFAKGELRRGSEKVVISWKQKEKNFWGERPTDRVLPFGF
jgi:P-type conjugative transfer protein TrbG